MADKEYGSGAGCIGCILVGVVGFFCIPILVGIWVLFDPDFSLVVAIGIVGVAVMSVACGVFRSRQRLLSAVLRRRRGK